MSSFGLESGSGSSEHVDKALHRLLSNVEGMDEKALNDKLDKVISLIDEINSANRVKTATLFQILFTMEDNLTKRIEDKEAELLDQLKNDSITARTSMAIPQTPPSLKAMFQKQSGNQVRTLGSMKTLAITPKPGFVIKTKKLLGLQEKAFINVFHHSQIELLPFHLPAEKCTDKPYIIVGPILATEDKKGEFSFMYNIGVSTEYFTSSSVIGTDTSMMITAPENVRKIIRKVNLKHEDFLDESTYSIPRLAKGYKGSEIPPMLVPVRVDDKDTPKTKQKLDVIEESTSAADALEGTEHETNSVVSELTHDHENSSHAGDTLGDSQARRRSSGDSQARSKKAHHDKRKSVFDSSSKAYQGGTTLGRNLMHGDMCSFVETETVDSRTAKETKLKSSTHPAVLLGWQIKIEEVRKDPAHKSDKQAKPVSVLYVVTDVRKNFLQKTEFRLSSFDHDDRWELLKRADNKHGVEFRPMRKVLYGLEDEEADDALASVAT